MAPPEHRSTVRTRAECEDQRVDPGRRERCRERPGGTGLGAAGAPPRSLRTRLATRDPPKHRSRNHVGIMDEWSRPGGALGMDECFQVNPWRMFFKRRIRSIRRRQLHRSDGSIGSIRSITGFSWSGLALQDFSYSKLNRKV